MSDPQIPVPAVAVSPEDQSSDRVQSDANQVENTGRNTDDRTQSDADQLENTDRNTDDRTVSDANQVTNAGKLDELVAASRVPVVAAVSVEEYSSDRARDDADQVVNAAVLEHLASSSDELSANAARLSESMQAELHAATAQRARFMKIMFAMALMTIALLIPMAIVVMSGLSSRHVITDCVQPTGKCFKDGQARTATVVQQINKVAVLAAVCAPDYVQLPIQERTIAIENCIKRELTK